MNSPFRGDIPAYKSPPDRTAWQEQHGVAPYSLGRVRDAYVSRALGAVQRDFSTIEFDAAIDSQVRLDSVYERVHADCGLPETALVFFDPNDETFWAYPEGPSTPSA